MIKGYYQKQPWEQETVKIEFADRMASLVVLGYAISAVAVKIYDSGAVDVSTTMIEGTPGYSGTDVFVTIKAGTDGSDYFGRIQVTASKTNYPDQKIEEDLVIKVRQEGKA